MEACDIEPSSKKLKKINNKDEEEEFVKLFDEVLKQNRGDLSDEDIADGVEQATIYFTQRISGACDREKFSDARNLCGFFHRLTPLSAGTIRDRILTAFRHCSDLKSCFHRPSLKIVDIGSGAGGDLVGLYSALFDQGFPFQSLQVTAMDYNNKWEIFFEGIVEKLRQGNFGNASNLFIEKEIECSFVCFDVLRYDCKEEKKITEADVILIKGFLSILDGNIQRYNVIEKIVSAMKPGSLLIILESPSYERYFQNSNLSLIFTTRKFLPASPESQNTCSTSQSLGSQSTTQDSIPQASCSASHRTWENFDPHKDSDKYDYYEFRRPAVTKYGPGLAVVSNQQIFVLLKKE